MSAREERFFRALASDEISFQMLSKEEKDSLEKFEDVMDRLCEERGVSSDEGETYLYEEAFDLVPGSREALDKLTKLTDSILSAGRG